MSARRLLLLAAAILSGCTSDPLAAFAPGVSEGREGAALLRDARAAVEAQADSAATVPDPADVLPADLAAQVRQSADVLISGLAAPDVARDVQARLWHTLGLARATLGAAAEADSAYTEALARADEPQRRAQYAFDAGTAALLAGDPERAAGLLRRALVLDPARADARRNYEIARRALDEDAPPEPSDFAQQIKAQADSLVAARQYEAALDVMQGGLARDSSVAAYADFTDRLSGVAQIEAAAGAPSPPDLLP